MAYFPSNIIKEVDAVAHIGYIDLNRASFWNQHRGKNELRALTGWYWSARDGSGREQSGFKTASAAYRDAYYRLVQKSDVPTISTRRLRRVA